MTIIPSVLLHSSGKYNLRKGNNLAEDKPEGNHLDVRGGGQVLHLADEDGHHHQHGGQVHTEGRLKEERLEESGDKSDCSQKKGRAEGVHHLDRFLDRPTSTRSQAGNLSKLLLFFLLLLFSIFFFFGGGGGCISKRRVLIVIHERVSFL